MWRGGEWVQVLRLTVGHRGGGDKGGGGEDGEWHIKGSSLWRICPQQNP